MPISGKRSLRAAGAEVRVHDEIFPQGTRDTVWLAEAGEQGWVVLTKDARIRYRANETQALKRAKVQLFVLTAGGDLRGDEMGAIFIKALPSIQELCRRIPPPFIAHVTKAGSVRLVKSGMRK